VGDDAVFHGAELSFLAEQFFHRCYWFAFAGDDEIEVTEIGVYVQGKAVGCYPARNVNANGCDLPALCVNAGQALDAERADAEVRQRPN